MYRLNILIIALLFFMSTIAQQKQLALKIDTTWNKTLLNTAKNETYMTDGEKQMIEEINRVRSNPKKYCDLYIQPLLKGAKELIQEYGNGEKKYSVTNYRSSNGDGTIMKRDTSWYYSNLEYLKALESLIEQLNNLNPLSILKPDKGIYTATTKHAEDQKKVGRNTGVVEHRGSDNSMPWDRIMKYSPQMGDGNENLVCYNTNVRGCVILLLIDDGIESKGHRKNLLASYWTHCACKYVGQLAEGYCQWWIQNFGMKSKLPS